MNIISKGYSRMISLYPLRFRQRFEDEMPDVFSSSLVEARRQGFWAVIGLYLKEFTALPASIAGEYIQEIKSGEGSLNLQTAGSGTGSSDVTFDPVQPSTPWSRALLAGLPHIMLGILIGLPQVLISLGFLADGNDSSAIAVRLTLVIPILGSLVIAIYAWRNHWPAWSASWSLYWIVFFFGLVYLVGNILRGNNGSLNTALMPWPVIIPLGTAYLLYRFARQDKLQGVLAALPLMLLIWLPYLERTPMWVSPEGWIGSAYLTTWVAAGLVAIVILRLNNWKTSLFLALAVSAVSGLFHSYIGIYHGGVLPFTEPGPSLKAVFNAFIPPFLLSAAVLIGPQLARQIHQLGLICGMKGKIAYRAALLGMLVVLGVILAVMAEGSSGVFTFQKFDRVEGILAAIGLILYTVPLAILIIYAIETGKAVPAAWLVQLFFLPLGIPIALVIGVPVGYLYLPAYMHKILILVIVVWVPIAIGSILKDPLHTSKAGFA